MAHSTRQKGRAQQAAIKVLLLGKMPTNLRGFVDKLSLHFDLVGKQFDVQCT